MLELSDYEENEEAHKSSNVECVEVNNGIKMANKRSKSLEKEKAGDCMERQTTTTTTTTSNELLKRPDTAPPQLLPDLAAKMEVEQCPPSNLMMRTEQSTDVNSKTDNSADHLSDSQFRCDTDCARQQTASWHEHIYRKPPKTPTPYSIVDILGWGSDGGDSNVSRKRSIASDNNNNSSRSYQNVEPSTLQHLLNLNIKTPPSPPRNYHSNDINNRGMSLSETSEDESIASDQPLNLCLTKSRDSSPATDKPGKAKKGIFLNAGLVVQCQPMTCYSLYIFQMSFHPKSSLNS